MSKVMSFRVDNSYMEKLNNLSKSNSLSKTQIIKNALDRYEEHERMLYFK